MAGCKVQPEASPQFKKLCEHWRRQYPSIASDLLEAFDAISQNILAKKGTRLQTGANFEVYKYRQNSRDIGRGASYGWRIIALFNRQSGNMYPIIVYPKTALADVSRATVREALNELLVILGYCIVEGCDGTMAAAVPPEVQQEGNTTHTKMTCQKCGATQWATA